MKLNFQYLLFNKVHIAPLVSFRILFGFSMLVSTIRFWYKGWIEAVYITPTFFFTYYGFDWVQPLSPSGMYALYALMIITSLAITFGFIYRIATIIFFLTFTYIELIDKTNYLNHYYFVSLISFLMCFVPAHYFFSIDALLKPSIKKTVVSAWCINIFKFQLACVYFFAGIAKIQADWLFRALPLKMWLPVQSELPIIGWFLKQKIVAYLFSWFGCIYDLFVAFLLMFPTTRILAYVAVVGFHIMTGILFPIGMFPYIMILCTLIFFSTNFHLKFLSFFGLKNTLFLKVEEGAYSNVKYRNIEQNKGVEASTMKTNSKLITFLLLFWISVQLLLPFRYLWYPADLFWHEQGYRFSWRVMLMEKVGYASFYVTDPQTGRFEIADNTLYLTPNQIKMMSTQPDMILQFAHYLGTQYEEKRGIENPEVRAEVYATLNGSPSQLLIDKTVDLTKIERSFQNKEWILKRK